MSTDILNKWYSSIKRLLFKYKNGFFELPIMSNSPETIIDGVAKMPFVKHLPDQKYFGTNNPFMKVDAHYKEIEEGLWTIHSNAHYYENVNYIQHKNKYIKSDYYLLFLELTQSKIALKNGLIDGVPYSNISWVFLKPNSSNTHCRFKESNTTSLSLFMSQKWVDKNLLQNKDFLNGSFNTFLQSNAKLIMFTENIQAFEAFEDQSKKAFDTNSWNDFVIHFIDHFIQNDNIKNKNENLFKISEIHRRQILSAEQYLLDNINTSFIGIEELSQIVGLSPTKLKNDFKLVYGDTIFQFFRKKQLDAAKVIFQTKDVTVSQVAGFYGYSSSNKFSVAYKDYFGILPSEDGKENP